MYSLVVAETSDSAEKMRQPWKSTDAAWIEEESETIKIISGKISSSAASSSFSVLTKIFDSFVLVCGNGNGNRKTIHRKLWRFIWEECIHRHILQNLCAKFNEHNTEKKISFRLTRIFISVFMISMMMPLPFHNKFTYSTTPSHSLISLQAVECSYDKIRRHPSLSCSCKHVKSHSRQS